MKATNWRRLDDDYAIEWGGRDWLLSFADGAPGLRLQEDSPARFLVASGLAATGRRSDDAFGTGNLIGVELYHERVQATYEPKGWNGLTVRAAWGPSPHDDGLDLEIQASTSTVGELKKLEVLVESSWGDPALGATTPGRTTVEPRTRGSALLTYDGREPSDRLERLWTAPVLPADARTFAPLFIPGEIAGGSGGYLEMVHPYDASRRLLESVHPIPTPLAVRYALFGYDLEKGVVLRGRLRGAWLEGHDAAAPPTMIEDRRHRFLGEPPPLGI